MQPIIEIKSLGKRYNIQHMQGGYVALRDVLSNVLRRPFAFLKHKTKKALGISSREDFWALKDISFNVKKGEVIGIIGSNGAGKSTLLKILTGITPPTEGEAVLRGRVSSLLEVGTGFHPELTGRENIFLNGAILGMTQKEISRKFDDIVAFSGVEKFLDTPVKHYSSGMQVRLAVSVAAHMEPDILIVDEVLAVGDAEFQKKCLGKMEEATRKDGRTILFVSHNLAAVERICNRAILIEKGKITKDSTDVSGTIKTYLQSNEGVQGYQWKSAPGDRVPANQWCKPTAMYLQDEKGRICDSPIRNDEPASIIIEGEILEPDPLLTIGYALYTEEGALLYWTVQTDQEESAWPGLSKGPFTLRSAIPQHMLNEGSYRVELIGGLNDRLWLFAPGGNNPTVHFSIRGGLSDSPYWSQKRPGILAPVISWTANKK